jgi:predicted RNase H-like HicB family nuclease
MVTTEVIKENLTEKQSYRILIEYQENGLVNASVLGWQNCRVTAKNKEEALQQLQQLLTIHHGNQEIVSLEVGKPEKENPWLKFAGMFKDDPLFDEVLDFIAEEREKENQELEAVELISQE